MKVVYTLVFCLGVFVLLSRFVPTLLLTAGFVPLVIGMVVVGWLFYRKIK